MHSWEGAYTPGGPWGLEQHTGEVFKWMEISISKNVRVYVFRTCKWSLRHQELVLINQSHQMSFIFVHIALGNCQILKLKHRSQKLAKVSAIAHAHAYSKYLQVQKIAEQSGLTRGPSGPLQEHQRIMPKAPRDWNWKKDRKSTKTD